MRSRPRRRRALAAALLLVGCSSHVAVTATGARSVLTPSPRPGAVALFIDPVIASTRVEVPIGSEDPADESVSFDLGAGLVATIEGAAQGEFATVHPAAAAQCATADTPVITVALAAPPSLQTRWIDDSQRGTGGGTAAEFALLVTALPCGGRPRRARVATGFGAADHFSRFANLPGAEDFALGVETALQDLANNLRVAFRDVAPEA